jgi:hypothetical protein
MNSCKAVEHTLHLMDVREIHAKLIDRCPPQKLDRRIVDEYKNESRGMM